MSEGHVKAIAIDYDGCIAINSWPEVGEPNWPVINRAKKERANGAKLILWTCREGDKLEEALNACWKWGLRFDAVNVSLPEWIEEWGNDPRKIGASEYWDDRAVRMPAPWISVKDRLPKEEWEKFTAEKDWDVYPLLAVVAYKRGGRYVTKLFYTGENFVDDECVQYTESVTHWMPLPEPPEEG